jgi:hypothetical protein
MLVPDLLQTLIETLAALLKYRWLHGRWSIWTMPTSPHPERCQFQEAATLQAASNPVCTSNRITTWYPLSFPASHMSWITINIIHGTYSNMYMWIYAYIYNYYILLSIILWQSRPFGCSKSSRTAVKSSPRGQVASAGTSRFSCRCRLGGLGSVVAWAAWRSCFRNTQNLKETQIFVK